MTSDMAMQSERDNMLPLKGKVVLVTGASRGIGAASAEALARAGASIFLAAEGTEAELNDVASRCKRASGSPAAFGIFDLSNASEASRMVDAAVSNLGRVDVLINNAGIRIRHPFGEFTSEEFDKLVAVNLRAPFLASQAVLPTMRKIGGGRIINVASQMGLVAAETSALYGMAKAALIYLTKAMAVDLAKQNITVNTISPGPIATEFTMEQMRLREGYKEQREALVPLGRWGTPEEIAEAIVFLASTSATFLHGSNLLIDGGYTLI